MIPENPQDSDADRSDADDHIEHPDDHPTQAEGIGDTSVDSMDDREMCIMVTVDIGPYTGTIVGGATCVQRVCRDGNVRSATCSCV